ncbi:unnamed protein product [Colias eurytheme]|nr:unnamed protein product [Colias eurytheme]
MFSVEAKRRAEAAGAARSVGAALRPPPAQWLRPRAPLRKIIMQLPGRPMWNALRPQPARNSLHSNAL